MERRRKRNDRRMSVSAEAPSNSSPSVPETGAMRAVKWLVWLCFAGFSLFVVGTVAWHVVFDGLTWTGTFGYVFDSMQYLAWTREMGEHVFSANMFSLDPPVRNYINPGLKISGVLYWLGVPPPWAYGIWVPLGIVSLIYAVTKLTRNMSLSGWAAIAAIAIALLYKLPAGPFVKSIVPKSNWNATVYAGYDTWPSFWSWGYSLTAIAVSLLCAGVMVYERERNRGKAISVPLAAIALVTSWLQPWQGALLLGMVVLGELLALRALEPDNRFPKRPRLTLVITTCVAGVLPLAYYAVMGAIDDSWRINGLQANRYLQGVSWWTPLLVLFPLLIAAIPEFLRRPQRISEIMIRLWPPLAIAQMLVIAATGVGNTAQHALKGVSIPLAILAVKGVSPWFGRLTPRLAGALGVAAILALTIPGAWYQLKDQSHEMTWPGNGGYYIRQSDQEALDFLAASPQKGGVVASSLIGSMVPWQTGRQTWVGHETWTPRFQSRSYFMEVLLGGGIPYWNPPGNPAAVVGWSGAKWLVDDCFHSRARKLHIAAVRKKNGVILDELSTQLKSVTAATHRFGCATVYELKPKSGGATPPEINTYRLDWTKRDG